MIKQEHESAKRLAAQQEIAKQVGAIVAILEQQTEVEVIEVDVIFDKITSCLPSLPVNVVIISRDD